MAVSTKRRRSAFDNRADHVMDLPSVVISPIVASTSKNKDTAIASRQNHVPGEHTSGLSPPRKKLKGKSAIPTTEPSTLMKPPVASGRITRASSVLVPDTPLRSLTSSRTSVRLAKGVHPYTNIYPHLATKDALDSDELRGEHGGTGDSITAGSSLKKKRGRPSRTIDIADEAAKTALMEQWANLRMSQGTLISSTTGGSLADTASRLPSNCGSQEPPSGGRLEVEIPVSEVVEYDKLLDFTPTSDDIVPTCPLPSVSSSNLVAELLPEMAIPNESIFTPQLSFATKNTSSDRFPLSEYDLRYPSSPLETSQPAIEDIAPSQHANVGTVEKITQAAPHSPINGSPELANQPLQLPATDSEVVSLRPSITHIMSKLDISPILEGPVPIVGSEDAQSRVPLSAVDIQLLVSAEADVDDATLGFHMLDLHEVLSPWVPVSSTAPSVYVPPAVHHLISGMKHQLEIECQARRRVEELYLEEMRKRIKMEEVIHKLQNERIQTRKQDASQTPPSQRPSVHASAEVAGQQGGEAVSTDPTHSKMTTECSRST
ncbi:hypothetical protein AZE42_00301 [Rhizopogon vesiculosus]|uniref:Uncharacterized protein n=1 Tax=Rhizopogon vesiculosus TaxID=180088 RepID=A0A1J8PQL0_9AGAM|nr:hypothetical protein AZE42_00301 [Rhizopogon vesiculosus]